MDWGLTLLPKFRGAPRKLQHERILATEVLGSRGKGFCAAGSLVLLWFIAHCRQLIGAILFVSVVCIEPPDH